MMQAWPGDGAALAPPALVERVKMAQRQSPLWKEAWHRYCDACPSQPAPTRDPAKHLQDFVSRFVAVMDVVTPQAHVTTSSVVATARPPSRVAGGGLQRVASGGVHFVAGVQLVEKVKEAQKLSQENRQLWHQYCDAEGAGVRDPTRHEAAFLQKFLAELTRYAQPGQLQQLGRASDVLVQQVKQAQRSDAEYKEAWHAYCDTEGNNIRDPSAHSDAFLVEFLTRYGLEVPVAAHSVVGYDVDAYNVDVDGQVTPEVTPYGASVIGSLSGGGCGQFSDVWPAVAEDGWVAAAAGRTPGYDGALVDQIKSYQKTSAEHMERWRQFCDAEGEGRRDPAKHDAAFLEQFLATCSSIHVEVAPAELVEQVKHLQRSSPQMKVEWHQYCDSEGDRIRDPARHSSAFLEAFIAFAGPLAAPGGVKRQMEMQDDGGGMSEIIGMGMPIKHRRIV